MTDFQPLISAVPVVIGGLLTILGALAVQRMTTEREAKPESTKETSAGPKQETDSRRKLSWPPSE